MSIEGTARPTNTPTRIPAKAAQKHLTVKTAVNAHTERPEIRWPSTRSRTAKEKKCPARSILDRGELRYLMSLNAIEDAANECMADAGMDNASEAIGQTSPAEGVKNRCCFQGYPSKGIYPRESPCSIRQLRLAGMASVFLYATSGRARQAQHTAAPKTAENNFNSSSPKIPEIPQQPSICLAMLRQMLRSTKTQGGFAQHRKTCQK